MSKRRWEGRVYLGRDENGKQLFERVGSFATKRERDKAVALRKLELEEGPSGDLPTCDAYVDTYLAEYKRRHKGSSLDTQAGRLRAFKKDFAGRLLDIPRGEARDWVNGEGKWRGTPHPSDSPAVISLYNYAIDEDDLPLVRNPFRKLSCRSKGRSEKDPITPEEFQALLDAAERLGGYGKMTKAMLQFAAFTLMRPSEIYPLEWSDIDFEAMRIKKHRRLYKGGLDDPKTGKKLVALTPPARDAIVGIPRESRYVFTSKTGRRISQSMFSDYWNDVCIKAGIRVTFYEASKHYGVWYMWTQMGMSSRAIAGQAGWKISTVDQMLDIYGHGEVGALDEVDRAFAQHSPQFGSLRAVK